jgi:hypothetical protein
MTLVHADSRGRLSLGKILDTTRPYKMSQGSHGEIILEPVSIITDYERAVLARPDIVAGIERGLAQIATGESTRATRGDRIR